MPVIFLYLKCYIWDGDWYKNYKNSCSSPYTLDEIKEKVKNVDIRPHGFHDSMFDLGPIYGAQWRNWNSGYERDNGYNGTDQIQQAVDLLRTNPDSRRIMVNAWNVGELENMFFHLAIMDSNFIHEN